MYFWKMIQETKFTKRTILRVSVDHLIIKITLLQGDHPTEVYDSN